MILRVLRRLGHKIGCHVRIPYLEDIGFLGKDPRDVDLKSLDKAVVEMMSVEMTELPWQKAGEG